MPVIRWKNQLYRQMLPLFGLRIRDQAHGDLSRKALGELEAIFRRHHVVGAALQLLKDGELGPLVTYGYARLPAEKVKPATIFRAASITKMVTAAGALILAESGLLNLQAPLETYLNTPVRNPRYPGRPVTLEHLLSHTAGLRDSPLYERAFHSPIPLQALLSDPGSFIAAAPGQAFCYSNLGAGMVGSVMERVSGKSLERLMRELVFTPLQMNASYTLKHWQDDALAADIYKVFPAKKAPRFHAAKRFEAAEPLLTADPESHYLLGAGSLFTDAPSLGRFLGMLTGKGSQLLSQQSLAAMRTPKAAYGEKGPFMRHCLGLVLMEDKGLCSARIFGHQGFAYGAAEGAFFREDTGDGLIFLNSGASELRQDHLALVNRDLIACTLGNK